MGRQCQSRSLCDLPRPNNDRTFIGSVVLTDAGNTEGLNNYMVTGYLRPDINLDGLVIFQGR
jgi:hypothetical protein